MNTKPMLIAALFCCAALSVSAQTRRIEHRSHSGAAVTFRSATGDHFGLLPPERRAPILEKPVRPDTVKVIRGKPRKQFKGSLPPAVNPIYTKTKPAARKTNGRSK
jgi:hypothetical protein